MTRIVGCLGATFVLALAALGGALQAVGGLGGDADAAGEAAATGPGGVPMVRPVTGAAVSQGFGCTAFTAEPVDPACPQRHVHTGIDLAAPLGRPVSAALGGRVHVVHSLGGFGLHVLVTPAAGPTTLYGHLEDVAVTDGDVVATGDVVGSVGSTGNSTGPHLHFEVRVAGLPVDPARWVALP